MGAQRTHLSATGILPTENWQDLDPRTLLSPEQAGSIRRRTTAYLAKERARGEGPRYIRDGRMIRYRVGDVLAFLESREVGTTDQPATTTATP